MGKDVTSQKEGNYIIETVDENFKRYQVKVKGWVMSHTKPPVDLTKDENSISFGGMSWRPEMDIYNLNHPALYFAKKVRAMLTM